MARSIRRRSTPISPRKTRAPTTSPQQTRRSKRVLGHEPERLLDTLDEQDDTITVQVIQDERYALPNPRSTLNLGNSSNQDSQSIASSAASLVSEDSASLERDPIVDNFRDISQNTQILLSLFKTASPAETFQAINTDSSRTAKRFEKSYSRLQTDLEPCGRGSRIFLQIPRLLRAFNVQGSLVAGIEAIFCGTNLAIFVSKLAKLESGDLSGRYDLLQCLAMPNGFPQLFCGAGSTIEGTIDDNFQHETAELGLAILTQHFIETAKAQVDAEGFDVDVLLHTIFLNEDGRPRDMSLGIVMSDAVASYTTREIRASVRHIKLMFEKNSHKRAIQRLTQLHPWSHFSSRAISWATSQDIHLQQLIDKNGGMYAINDAAAESVPIRDLAQSVHEEETVVTERDQTSQVDLLRDERGAQLMDIMLDTHYDSEDALGSEQLTDDESHGQRAHFAEASIHSLHTVLSKEPLRHEIPAALSQERQKIIPRPRSLTPLAPQDEEQDYAQDLPDMTRGLPQPSQMTVNIRDTLRAQEKDSDKENTSTHKFRLHERQPDATRVSWDDETQERTRRPDKRRRREVSGTDDEVEFEADTRNSKRPRPYKGKAKVSAVNNRDTSPMFVPDTDDAESEVESIRAAAEPTRQPLAELQRPPISQSGPSTSRLRTDSPSRSQEASSFASSPGITSRPRSTVPPVSSFAAQHEQVKKAAAKNITKSRLMAARDHPIPIKPTQVRRPWDTEELECFMTWMEKLGPAWARIKEGDFASNEPKLEGRTQVQLKDKARNMKLDFLKAELELPWYLESVTISKQQIADLRRRNIVVPSDIDG